MPFEPALLQDLADYESFLTWRSGATTSEPTVLPSVQRDLMLLHAETLKVAAFVAAATSLATHALYRSSASAGEKPGLSFTAAFSAAAESRMALIPQVPELFGLHRTWVAVEAKLAFANALVHERAAGDGASVISIDIIADAWIRAAEALLDWHQNLSAVIRGDDTWRDHASEAAALRLLQQAATGKPACIDADGKLTLPGWAERRIDPRLPIAIDATTFIGLDAYPSRIENLSRRGLRIAVDAEMPIDTPVTFTLPETQIGDRWLAGRILSGRVRWSNDGSFGIALDEPLSADDPLWLAASEAK